MSDLIAASTTTGLDHSDFDHFVSRFLEELEDTLSPTIATAVRELWEEICRENAAEPADRRALVMSQRVGERFRDTDDEGAIKTLMDRCYVPFPSYDFERAEMNERPWGEPTGPVEFGTDRWMVLGHDVGVPIGVPASPLTLNSHWVEHHARNGFNVLTFKTVRPRRRQPNDFPIWVFLSDSPDPLVPNDLQAIELQASVRGWPRNVDRISSVNSFGVPSPDPKEWIKDVKRARDSLAAHQILILSVMGEYEDRRGQDLVDDFALVATLAASTGVDAIELNLSCPSGIGERGEPLPPICQDPEMVFRIVDAVRPKIDATTALVVKFGYLNREEVAAALHPISGVIQGVSGVNTIQAAVSRPGGADLFPGRPQGGLSGYALKELAKDFVRSVYDFREEGRHSFDILGMGGVMNADDALRLFECGADVVQTATGACFNHQLASQVARRMQPPSSPTPVRR